MEIRMYAQMLRRGWWIVLLTTLIALVAALAVSYLATPQYEAVARLIVTPNTVLPDRPDITLQGLNILNNQSVMTTYTEVMNSNRIYNDALATLQLQPRDLQDYTYNSVVDLNSTVISLTVTGPNPQLAAKFANTIGDETISFTRRLSQVYNVDFLDTAVAPVVPSSPKPLLNAGLAIALGLLVGSALAIMSEQLRLPWETFRQSLRLDGDTGVLNSKYFARRVEEERAKKPDEVLTVGIIEVSAFRDVLETFPVAATQKVLQKVTDSLRQELRGNDVIGRWNEESFIVMLPNTTGAAADLIFKRIFRALSQPLDLDQFGTLADLDAYIGGAEQGNDITPPELFEKANRALVQAQRNNTTHVFVMNTKDPLWSEGKAS